MDKDKEETGQDELRDELQDEIVATLRYLQKAQKRLEIGLIIGFVLLAIWAQWNAVGYLLWLTNELLWLFKGW